MPSEESAKVFQRSVGARFQTLKSAYDETVMVFGHGSPEAERQKKAATLAAAANDLSAMLAEPDRPQWLNTIREVARDFAKSANQANGKRLIDVFINHGRDVQPLPVLTESLEAYSFDALFRKLRDKHGIPAIFDKLAAELQKIIESGEIDTTTVTETLQRMLNAIRANRNGSLASIKGSFSFARFGWNVAVETVKEVPGLAAFANAFEKTLEQGEQEVKSLEDDLMREAIHTLTADMKLLKRLPQFQQFLLESNKPSEAAPAQPRIEAEEAEEAEFEVKTDTAG